MKKNGLPGAVPQTDLKWFFAEVFGIIPMRRSLYMKKIWICVIIFVTAMAAQAQEISLKKNATVYVTVNNTAAANNAVEKMIDTYEMIINTANVNNSTKICEYELFVTDNQLSKAVSEIEKLGQVELKEINSFNYSESIKSINYDLEYLQSQKEIYGNEISSTGKNESYYTELFKREREIDNQIYEKNKEIADLNNQSNLSILKVRLSEREIQDLDSYDSFSGFINMPGVETKYFHFENDNDTTLNDNYFGGSLRYMFTKGRSYFLIGVMKPLSGSQSAGTVNDIVSYGIGKDFYPRYFGQGKNTFFNPFSGFEIGGMILTSEDAIEHMYTVEPHLGLEIFKNKYVIFDMRIGYVFPLDENYIKSRRGFSNNFSLNIVF